MQAKTLIVLAFVALALVLAGFLMYGSGSNSARAANQTYVFQVNGKEFDISLVAANQSSQEKGLMNMTIKNTTLMVFVFPSLGIYPFWMENTYSNLDIMWLNISGGSGTVAYLVSNAISCVGKSTNWCEDNDYTPNTYANYVIEAKAGFAEANNISVGTVVGLSRKS